MTYRLVHLISGLNTGGAETMLYNLLSRLEGKGFSNRVVSMSTLGPLAEKIQRLGIPVQALGMRRGIPDPLVLLQWSRYLKEETPSLIQTWMYHADLFGGLAVQLSRRPIPLIWGIHNNVLDSSSRGTTRLTAWLCARLSARLPTRIISCSEAARQTHTSQGYAPEKFTVIPNGFDSALYSPSAEARAKVRHELGIGEEALLVGMAARFDPQKDHQTFFKALGLLSTLDRPLRLLLCGNGIDWQNQILVKWVDENNLRDKTILLGRREDMPQILAALDVLVSSSYAEAFPMAIGEAMACGVPCIVTDAGDSALLVGDTGRVVPIGNPHALAQALHQILALPPAGRYELGRAARQRVLDNFSLEIVTQRYRQVYLETLRK